MQTFQHQKDRVFIQVDHANLLLDSSPRLILRIHLGLTEDAAPTTWLKMLSDESILEHLAFQILLYIFERCNQDIYTHYPHQLV